MTTTKRKGRNREVLLLVGTRKGALLLRSDLRRRTWKTEGPFFAGMEVNHFIRDPRTGRLWAAAGTSWWGNQVQASSNNGKTWHKSDKGLKFASNRGLTLNKIWHICPDREARPNTLWCGVDPGALFRTDDGGKNWYEVKSLAQHPTRKHWQPGGGGMCTHTIIPDPKRPSRIYAAISAAGCFRSDDDGKSWKPMNRGVRADFLPKKFPEVGQCVHRLVMSPTNSDWLFQQNHCGVYRSKNGGERWRDISKGVPSRFGFPMMIHPHESQTIYVVPEIGAERRYVCGAGLAVWKSSNGGRSWTKLTRGLPQDHVYTAVLRHAGTTDSCDDVGIYVGTTGGEIFYSRNGGKSWELLRAHLPTIFSLEAAVV